MATNVTRITNSGTFLVNGNFDEFTGAPVIDGNVVLWLDAGQTSSYSGTGNTWTNLANASANTTLVGSPTFNTSGWFLLDGSTQSANTGLPGATTFTTDSEFTIACWVNFTAYKPAATSIGTLTGAFYYQGYGLYWQGTPTTYNIGSYMRYVNTVSSNLSAAVVPGSWYYAVQTYSRAGNFHRLYINGVQSASTTTISGAYNTNLNTVSIGIGYGAGSDGTPGGATSGTPLNGSVSQVMIYNRALTAGEVLQNYNALAGRYGLAANTSGTAIQRTTSNTVLAEQFDEVTYNTTSPTIKNLVTYSQQIGGTNWVGAPGSFTLTSSTQTAPDGSNTASLITSIANTATYLYQDNIAVTPNTTYTFSFYAKLGTATNSQYLFAVYNASALSFIAFDQPVTLNTSTYTRVTYTFTTPVGCSLVRVYPFRNASTSIATPFTFYVWGAQLEQGSTATIYQPIAAANTLVSTGMVQRVDSGGNMYVSNTFDEFTGAPVVNSSLVLWIDPGQTTSYPGTGTTVTDLSGSNNTLTLGSGASPTFNTNTAGGSFDFNGTSQYGYIPYSASLAPTAGLSVGCWAYLPSWNIANNIRLISKTEVGGYNLGVNDIAGNLSAAFNISSVYYNPRIALTSVSNGWHYVAATCDGRYSILYLDGVAVNTIDKGSTGTITYTNNNNFVYGAESGGGAGPSIVAGFWTGTLGPVMIYNRALTADEVAQNYNALKRRYGLS